MNKLLLLLALALTPCAFPRGSHGAHSSARCASCARSSRGRIARNPEAVREFKRTHPCPGSCKGMVVDHIIPLKRGGSDTPDNMQWQTKEAAKAKDKIE